MERWESIAKGAYSLTPELYSTLAKGNVIVFAEHGGKENHTSILLCGKGLDVIKELTEELDAECRVSQMLLVVKKKQDKRIKELETEMQEVSNMLMDLYTDCSDSAEPKVYGAILGLHERLEKALKCQK